MVSKRSWNVAGQYSIPIIAYKILSTQDWYHASGIHTTRPVKLGFFQAKIRKYNFITGNGCSKCVER